jgi:hypothetical protein
MDLLGTFPVINSRRKNTVHPCSPSLPVVARGVLVPQEEAGLRKTELRQGTTLSLHAARAEVFRFGIFTYVHLHIPLTLSPLSPLSLAVTVWLNHREHWDL